MTVYESTYAATSFEIINTPFTQDEQGQYEYDPFLEVAYEWREPRFRTSWSPLEQRMMLVPTLAGMVIILLGIFLLPNVVFGSVTDTDVAVTTAETEGAAETAVSPPPITTGGISSVFSKEVKHWEPQIMGWAELYSLDPDIIATIMQIESCGDPNAVSSAGAQGLFQVMPFHFEAGEDMQYPDSNAYRGMKFYNTMLAHTGGDVMLSFAGYNGGYAAANNPYEQWPSETKRYLYWAQGIYEEAKAGAATSTRLQEWMNAGGIGLCQQAANRLGIQ